MPVILHFGGNTVSSMEAFVLRISDLPLLVSHPSPFDNGLYIFAFSSRPVTLDLLDSFLKVLFWLWRVISHNRFAGDFEGEEETDEWWTGYSLPSER
jgi:hypothetical protein